MQMIVFLEGQLQKSIKNMYSQPIDKSIAFLKKLQKDIRQFITKESIDFNQKLYQMDIGIYNNLACLYERKGKFKSSLYHLQIAQNIQNAYVTKKYQKTKIPNEVLVQLSTTYSNLCAIQLKLNNHSEAIINIQFALDILNRSQGLKEHISLVYLLYNYAILLEITNKIEEASKYCLKGLQLSQKYSNSEMIPKYKKLIKILQEKLVKIQVKKDKQMDKYLKGQIGITKTIQQIKSEEEQNKRKKSKKKSLSVNEKIFSYTTFSTDKLLSKPQLNQKTIQDNKNYFTLHRFRKNVASEGKRLHLNSNPQNLKIQNKIISRNKSIDNQLCANQKIVRTRKIFEAYGNKLFLKGKKDTQWESSRAKIASRRRNIRLESIDIGNTKIQKIIQKLYLKE